MITQDKHKSFTKPNNFVSIYDDNASSIYVDTMNGYMYLFKEDDFEIILNFDGTPKIYESYNYVSQ
ncbi:hypothetical protein D3C76_1479570 [compost metagenome]